MQKCPLCGTPGAYVGLMTVDCVFPECDNYTGLGNMIEEIGNADHLEFEGDVTVTEKLYPIPSFPPDSIWSVK